MLKRLVKATLAASGLIRAALQARGESFILMFHGVGTSDMPAARFETLLERLGRWFAFRSTDDLLNRDPTDKPSLYLTFDDGLRNNFTIAYPILQRLSIPATFYVCPELIDSKSWIWTYDARARLGSLSCDARSNLSRATLGSDFELSEMISAMKDRAVSERQKIEASIRRATPAFAPDATQRHAFDLMDWHELRGLSAELITIGSHTMTHAMLDSATPEEAEVEIAASRTALENALDREIVHFCYPDGRVGDAAEAVVKRTFRTAVLTKVGPIPAAPDPHRLPRVPAYSDFGEMAWMLYRARHHNAKLDFDS